MKTIHKGRAAGNDFNLLKMAIVAAMAPVEARQKPKNGGDQKSYFLSGFWFVCWMKNFIFWYIRKRKKPMTIPELKFGVKALHLCKSLEKK